MTYVEEHAGAVEAVREAGAAWTFTHRSPGTPQPVAGGFAAPQTTVVTGYAIRVKGEGEDKFGSSYQSAEMTTRSPLTLLFVPDNYGESPPVGSVGSSGGVSGRVKQTRSIEPDGVPIATYVVLE